MRQAGRLVAEALRLVESMAEAGVRTDELDRAAADHIDKQGATPAFMGHRGYPANICTSINEEVVHGIPGARELREGDLLKVDIGVIYEGYYGDAAVSVPIGEVSAQAQELVTVTHKALHAGIAVLKDGVTVREVSAAIQHVVEAAGFSVVADYTGHGIGRALWEDPKVPNYVPSAWHGRDIVLRKGAVVAIEPMVNVGTGRTEVLANSWTVVTKDRKLSAHFEHTVAVDEDGPVILTLP